MLLTEREARIVLHEVNNELISRTETFDTGRRKKPISGMASEFDAHLGEVIGGVGVQIAGTAMYRARGKIDFNNPVMYYDPGYNNLPESTVTEIQESLRRWLNAFDAEVQKIMDEGEELPTEEEELPLTKTELLKQYKTERARFTLLNQMISRGEIVSPQYESVAASRLPANASYSEISQRLKRLQQLSIEDMLRGSTTPGGKRGSGKRYYKRRGGKY